MIWAWLHWALDAFITIWLVVNVFKLKRDSHPPVGMASCRRCGSLLPDDVSAHQAHAKWHDEAIATKKIR